MTTNATDHLTKWNVVVSHQETTGEWHYGVFLEQPEPGPGVCASMGIAPSRIEAVNAAASLISGLLSGAPLSRPPNELGGSDHLGVDGQFAAIRGAKEAKPVGI